MGEIFNHESKKLLRRQLRKNSTETEKILWEFLRKRRMGIKFTRQFSIGPFVVDFYCPTKRLIIEIDGSQHYESEAILYDKKRTEYFESLGLRVLRFTNIDVYHRKEAVCDMILEVLNENTPG
jgi:very-short-patch-repair endonuclease